MTELLKDAGEEFCLCISQNFAKSRWMNEWVHRWTEAVCTVSVHDGEWMDRWLFIRGFRNEWMSVWMDE